MTRATPARPAMEKPSPSPWLPLPHANGNRRLRLFCLPYAGGGARVYGRWLDALGPEVDVLPVELPGRWGRLAEQARVRVDVLAPEIVEGIGPWLDRPFAFFGHSMGALLAFEVTRRLEAEGRGPCHLIASARRAPHLPEQHPPISHLPDDQFQEALRHLNGTQDEVLAHAELMRLMLPVLRADFAVCESYRFQPGVRLRCPITVLAGSEDPAVSIAHVEAWAHHTTGAFRFHLLPRNHFFLHSAHDEVLAIVRRDLETQLAALSGSSATGPAATL